MSEYKTGDIIKKYYDGLKGSDSYGKKDIKADVKKFSKDFVGVGENRKKNKGVSIYYRIEKCINIKPKDLDDAEIHTFNGDDAKEHMEWLKCLKDNRDIVGQFLFWIFYAITVGKKDGDTNDVDKDEVIGKLIKCCEDLEVTDEELEDVLCAVKSKMNCFLNQPEYHTELGKTFEILNPKENNQEKKDSTNQTPVDRKDELIRTFSNYMKAKYPMVLVDTIEDEEAVEIIKQASNDNGATVYQWNIVDGLVRDDGDGFVPTMQQASFEDFL